jgi:hypothetical protein
MVIALGFPFGFIVMAVIQVNIVVILAEIGILDTAELKTRMTVDIVQLCVFEITGIEASVV